MLWFLVACLSSSMDTHQGQIEEPMVNGERSSGGCATSCALEEKSIDQDEWLMALDTWSKQEVGVSTKALDTLLFYANDTKNWLPVFGSDLDDEHYFFLFAEIQRNLVDIEMRVVDENGAVRGLLESNPFHLKKKQHIAFSSTGSLGWLETGGKVKRVGLSHLWSRW